MSDRALGFDLCGCFLIVTVPCASRKSMRLKRTAIVRPISDSSEFLWKVLTLGHTTESVIGTSVHREWYEYRLPDITRNMVMIIVCR